MAQVFLSYARRDLPTLHTTPADLAAHGITIWRDQDNLYGGGGPKPLGKRLQPTTCCCSSGRRRPAASHFVEFGMEHSAGLAKKHPAVLAGSDATPSSAQRHQRH